MATITQLEQDNSNLNAINDDITDIISYLNSSVSELSSLSRNIETRYTVDDNSTPIIDRIKKLKEELEATSEFLSKKVLTGVDMTIQKNSDAITIIQEDEKKKEEEKKKASSASSSTSSSYSGGNSKPAVKDDKKDKKDDKWSKW